MASAAAAAALLAWAGAASAGAVFLTGHDPDYHAQGQTSGVHELDLAVKYVTGGTYLDHTNKFLWVESYNAPDGGHRVGFAGLAAIGVTADNVDRADAAQFATIDLSNYTAIVVASTFGGMLTDAEIRAMVARKTDIATFVNGGGGLAAFAECGFGFFNCDASNVHADTPLYGFVPVGASSSSTATPYTLTPAGIAFGLDPLEVNDCCTHNSFADAAGLTVLDFDLNGHPTTLAGNVRIGGGGFEPGVPEPAAWLLMILGFGAAGVSLRRARRAVVG
jgi:hypothetical protein